jgi:Sigma-70 factor, region 1.1/Sigma-70 factor, region 1.2/LysR substrate binding domain
MDHAAMSAGNMADEDATESPLPQIVASSIEELLARGSERGYVTYDELSATVPLDQLSSEEIEDTMTILSELGITVTEGDESEEPVAPEGEPAKAGGNLGRDDTGRIDDPVRMYLREMRSIQRLSREGEVATAKRIEAGREMMLCAIRESPLTFDALQRERIIAKKYANRSPQFLDLITRFLSETRLPVLSPDLMKKCPPREPADLERHTLLHAATLRDAWPRWMAAAHVPDLTPTRDQVFEHFYFAIQAALEGLGVVMGPLALISEEPRAGRQYPCQGES